MIIDAHAHILSPEIIAQRERLIERERWFAHLYGNPKARLATGDELVDAMDSTGVDISVAFGFSFANAHLLREGNAYVLAQAATHPGRIIPFAMVNPALPDASAEAERAIAAGARGLGELVPDAFGAPLDDAALWDPLCSLAAEAVVPILLHIAEQVGHIYPGKGSHGPEQAYRLIVRHPHTRFILAHWGGGLPFYELMPEVRQSLANVYYDTAASIYLYRDEIFEHVTRWAPDKVLFGSDYPLIGQHRALRRLRSALADDNQRNSVLGDNAARALGLQEDPA